MAKKARALIGFPGMKDDELMVAAHTIIGAMTGNPHFPAPSPSLEEVQDLLEDYATKLATAGNRGSMEDTALKNESKEDLARVLRKLGYYVNTVAEGHLSILLSSGFPTNKPFAPSLAPLPVEQVRLRDGRLSGQLRLDFAKQRNVRLYEYRYRELAEEEMPWSDRFTTTSSRGNIIEPLKVARKYEVQVRAVNSQGAGGWSDTVAILVR